MDNLDRQHPSESGKLQPVWKSHHQGYEGGAGEGAARPVPIGDLISLETVVNIMLNKGLCSEKELLDEERRLRDIEGHRHDSHFRNIDERGSATQQWDRPQHPLRKMFSKYRWSRRVGTAIFGWKWKKVKKAPAEEERMH